MGAKQAAAALAMLLFAFGCGDVGSPAVPTGPGTVRSTAGEDCDGMCSAADAEVCPADCDPGPVEEPPPADTPPTQPPPADSPAIPQPLCGDEICSPSYDEDAETCPQDCVNRCGDSLCTASEDSGNCWRDCGTACGDGVCNGFEDLDSCGSDCLNPEALATIRIQGFSLVQFFSDGMTPIDVENDQMYGASSGTNDVGFATSLLEVIGENNVIDDSYRIPVGSDGNLMIRNTVKLDQGRTPAHTIECDLSFRDAIVPGGFRPDLVLGAASSSEAPTEGFFEEPFYQLLCATNNWEEGTESGISLLYSVTY